MGKQKKAFIDTENEVAVQRMCKYIGSFAINMMKAEERQIMMNEKLEELKNVKKGVRVVLHVTTNGIKVFDEKETNVKMAHAILRVAFSTCCPDTRMFSYVAKSLKSSKNPSILQAHVFKTKKGSHAQQLSAVMSKAFRISFSMATVKRKNNEKEFDVTASEAQKITSQIEVKRRWAKKELARGHDFSEHAERARRLHPLARLPGKPEPMDQCLLDKQQSEQFESRERVVSNAEFDDVQMLQRNGSREPLGAAVNIQINRPGVNGQMNQNMGAWPQNAPSTSNMGMQNYPPGASYAMQQGQQWTPGPGHAMPQYASNSQQFVMPPNSMSANQPRNEIPGPGAIMPAQAPRQQVPMIAVTPAQSIAAHDDQVINAGPVWQTAEAQGLPYAVEELYQNVAEAEREHNQNAAQAGQELYQNAAQAREELDASSQENKEDEIVVEDIFVNEQVMKEFPAQVENGNVVGAASSKSADQASLAPEGMVLPEPDYGDDGEVDVDGAREIEPDATGVRLRNPGPADEKDEDSDDLYSTKDILDKSKHRQTTTEYDLLRDSYWFQPGLPREIAEEMLASERPGKFFIRESSSTSGSYAMSVRVPNNVKQSGVANILIQHSANGEYQIQGFKQSFTSLAMLVAFYASFQEEMPVRLLLCHENKLLLGDEDAADGTPEEAIALIDAVLPNDPDYTKYDSCDEIQQELDKLPPN